MRKHRTVVIGLEEYIVSTHITRNFTQKSWQVRMTYINQPYHSKYFGDSTYGGTKEALNAAKRYLSKLKPLYAYTPHAIRKKCKDIEHADKKIPLSPGLNFSFSPNRNSIRINVNYCCRRNMNDKRPVRSSFYAGIDTTINILSIEKAVRRAYQKRCDLQYEFEGKKVDNRAQLPKGDILLGQLIGVLEKRWPLAKMREYKGPWQAVKTRTGYKVVNAQSGKKFAEYKYALYGNRDIAQYFAERCAAKLNIKSCARGKDIRRVLNCQHNS